MQAEITASSIICTGLEPHKTRPVAMQHWTRNVQQFHMELHWEKPASEWNTSKFLRPNFMKCVGGGMCQLGNSHYPSVPADLEYTHLEFIMSCVGLGKNMKGILF